MLIDAHSHLQLPEYDADREAAIARMRGAGVGTITVGVDLPTSKAAIGLAEAHPDCLWAAVGVHPTSASWRTGVEDFDIESFRALAAHPKAVAIGECGLDYYRLDSANCEAHIALQKKVFLKQIAIAAELSKPLMIHCRPKKGTDDAYEDLYEILKAVQLKTKNYKLITIVHFFVGSPAVARKLVSLGCFFTFGGAITFTHDYDEAILAIPTERIMAETDAPFVAPMPHRGKRNEPAYVVEVVKRLAERKEMQYEAMAEKVSATARAVFGL